MPLRAEAHWYLFAFVGSLLVFGPVWRSGVPLYLSGRGAAQALARLLPYGGAPRLLDAGSGLGTVLAGVAALRPDARAEGVEAAILPCLISRLRGRGRYQVSWGDLWQQDFGRFDLVYAFLSPLPMRRLWDKARAEMRPGTLLVSNSFSVPGVAPSTELALGARRFYVWRM
jgi:hypothetical protein